jgi:uncharacterized protein
VTVEALGQIEAAEQVVRALGFREVRVRHHGAAASVEVPAPDVPRLQGMAGRFAASLRAIGFTAVRIAADGLRSGRFSAGLAGAATGIRSGSGNQAGETAGGRPA